MSKPIARVVEAPNDIVERVREYVKLKEKARRRKANGRGKAKGRGRKGAR